MTGFSTLRASLQIMRDKEGPMALCIVERVAEGSVAEITLSSIRYSFVMFE